MSFYPSQQPDPNEDMMMDHNQYQMYQQQNSQPMPQQLQIPMAGQIPQYSQFAPEHLFQQQKQQQGSEGFDGMNFVPPSQFNDFSNGGVGGYPQYEQQLFQQQQQQPQPFHQSEFQQPDFGVGMIPQHDQLQQQQHQQQQHQQQQGLPGMVGAPGQEAGNSRTVYLGNLPNDLEPHELLDYVRSGIIENVRIIPGKNCCFISFLDTNAALLMHSEFILKKINIKGYNIRVGWGKNTTIQPGVLQAVTNDGATRNVYLGNLSPQDISEEEIINDLSIYGPIECIKTIPEKGIAFVHFLSIASAIRCVNNLQSEKYPKVYYGKDRCAFITKTQQHNAAQYLGLAPGMEHIVTAADREFISLALVQQSAAAAQIATQAGGANNLGNRTVYLGNLHQDSSIEEICNVVRGGLLQSVRFLKERHVCFITFIDPIAAAQFFAMCQLHGLTIHNRRIKVGWGKHSGPLSNALSLAVSNGASRNIYIGNIVDFEYFNPAKLREDFTKFGDIEQINYLEEKNCAFINFINIANAIKAIDGIKSFEDYKNLKINFGKDRCGNLPRQFQNQLPLSTSLSSSSPSPAQNQSSAGVPPAFANDHDEDNNNQSLLTPQAEISLASPSSTTDIKSEALPIGGGALGIIEDGEFYKESTPF